jgi:hypothetical protein
MHPRRRGEEKMKTKQRKKKPFMIWEARECFLKTLKVGEILTETVGKRRYMVIRVK